MLHKDSDNSYIVPTLLATREIRVDSRDKEKPKSLFTRVPKRKEKKPPCETR